MGSQPVGLGQFGEPRFGDQLTIDQHSHSANIALSYTIGSLSGSISASAIWKLGISRLGDGLGFSLLPRINALGVSYSISPSKYAVPLSLTYTVQRPHTAPLLIYYLVAPPSRFSINGDSSIVRPDRMTPGSRPVTARTLLASPIIQGFETVTWSYSTLLWAEFQQIIGHYDPTNPIVIIGFPDQSGSWVLRKAVFHPPAYGEMQTMLIYNVSLSFSILSS